MFWPMWNRVKLQKVLHDAIFLTTCPTTLKKSTLDRLFLRHLNLATSANFLKLALNLSGAKIRISLFFFFIFRPNGRMAKKIKHITTKYRAYCVHRSYCVSTLFSVLCSVIDHFHVLCLHHRRPLLAQRFVAQ